MKDVKVFKLDGTLNEVIQKLIGIVQEDIERVKGAKAKVGTDPSKLTENLQDALHSLMLSHLVSLRDFLIEGHGLSHREAIQAIYTELSGAVEAYKEYLGADDDA